MKRYLILFVIIWLAAFSCSGRKKVLADTAVRDGSSFEKAIVINETSERTGVGDEYAWIRTNYPNSRNNGQALAYHEKTPYDILHITTADGRAISVYFDISKFYGKF